MKFELVATCLFGLEHLLGEEIDSLGYELMHFNGKRAGIYTYDRYDLAVQLSSGRHLKLETSLNSKPITNP